MTKQQRINQTIINLRDQAFEFATIGHLLEDRDNKQAQERIIWALSVITQELANITDDWKE
jgi:hypothetical protein